MKRKLTLSIDEELVKFGKEHATRQGTSLSKWFEDMLRQERGKASNPRSSVDEWYGAFSDVEDPDGERLRYLRERFG